MGKKTSHTRGLLDVIKSNDEPTATEQKSSPQRTKTINPAVNLAMGVHEKRPKTVKEPVLQLEHDQVIIFKYHDRHNSSLDTERVTQLRKSIEADGQHIPGVVRKTNETTKDGRIIYELIVGRLRFEASRTVGFFKAFIKTLTDAEAAKLMFSENEDRNDILPFERWLSILPLVDDKVLTGKEIAEMIGWDAGNFARTMKARDAYDALCLSDKLVDVTKVKLNQLVKIGSLYKEKPKTLTEAVEKIKANYPDRKNNLFLKSVISVVEGEEKPKTKTTILNGSKLKVKKLGEKVTLTFEGLPRESSMDEIVAALKEVDGFKK
ncbi:ParB/RepB/Spo0J family partition protein [Alteromonas gracilis]|uniref:ParB/RepB/Spo0J family partition protein n=1 Tax=Alteromonas gracilis TaxID=1479524 RepID=UPI003734F323